MVRPPHPSSLEGMAHTAFRPHLAWARGAVGSAANGNGTESGWTMCRSNNYWSSSTNANNPNNAWNVNFNNGNVNWNNKTNNSLLVRCVRGGA